MSSDHGRKGEFQLRKADIFTGFEGQYVPSEDEYLTAMRSALIVVDTNLLLDLYRYNQEGRDSLFSALEAVQDRLWVPHQVMKEFWKNRDSILSDPEGAKSLMSVITKAEGQITSEIRAWGKRAAHDAERQEEILSQLSAALKDVQQAIEALSTLSFADWSKDTTKDAVLTRLAILLQGRVGSPFDDAQSASAQQEALRRIDEKLPPGFKDKHKQDPKASGDYFVWAQILAEAKERNTDVLFITRDLKEDWLKRQDDELSGPHPFLVEEFDREIGRRFFLRSPVGFLQLAQQAFAVSVTEESLESARRLNQQQFNEDSLPTTLDEYALNSFLSGWSITDLLKVLNKVSSLDQPLLLAVHAAVEENGTLDDAILSTYAGPRGPESVADFRGRFESIMDRVRAEDDSFKHDFTSLWSPIVRRNSSGFIETAGYRMAEGVRWMVEALLNPTSEELISEYKRWDQFKLKHGDHAYLPGLIFPSANHPRSGEKEGHQDDPSFP